MVVGSPKLEDTVLGDGGGTVVTGMNTQKDFHYCLFFFLASLFGVWFVARKCVVSCRLAFSIG